mmetsp:Transcript_86052/g.240794  ORF Transcript_86052/g.240794 Transcript_86052/m.240794 type:complete len:207 (-) Transcript_86052:25-645(-)
MPRRLRSGGHVPGEGDDPGVAEAPDRAECGGLLLVGHIQRAQPAVGLRRCRADRLAKVPQSPRNSLPEDFVAFRGEFAAIVELHQVVRHDVGHIVTLQQRPHRGPRGLRVHRLDGLPAQEKEDDHAHGQARDDARQSHAPPPLHHRRRLRRVEHRREGGRRQQHLLVLGHGLHRHRRPLAAHGGDLRVSRHRRLGGHGGGTQAQGR